MVTLKQLFEAGVHFGHSTRRWNPKMETYIFGVRNGIHIIDLSQSVPLFNQALEAIKSMVSTGGRILFVGTKTQASEKIAEAAKRCGQYYINHRWLGGTLTNWKTINQSLKRLKEMEDSLETQRDVMTKKELLKIEREHKKMSSAIGGVREMGGLPDMLFVIDTNKESIAILEAKKLGIPVVAILDSNSDPAHINYPIPGNDDAQRSVSLYCDLVSDAVLEGLKAEMMKSGVDLGQKKDAPMEDKNLSHEMGIELEATN
jgi:small subunit ribosomal protein S2